MLFFLLTIATRQSREKSLQIRNVIADSITKISFSSFGGRSGRFESLDISSDSIIYVQGSYESEKSIREKTVRSLWNSLKNEINIRDFDKIQSNPGHAQFDGVDITLCIEKGKEKHSVVNGHEDTLNYKRIKAFTNILEKELFGLRKKMKW
jgi:hypothetical protein